MKLIRVSAIWVNRNFLLDPSSKEHSLTIGDDGVSAYNGSIQTVGKRLRFVRFPLLFLNKTRFVPYQIRPNNRLHPEKKIRSIFVHPKEPIWAGPHSRPARFQF